MKNANNNFDFIEDVGGERPSKFGVNRKTPDRLFFNNSVSPIKIERLFKYALFEFGYLEKEKKCKLNSFSSFLNEQEITRINDSVRNSILYSFKFNKQKYPKFKYLDSVEESIYEHKSVMNFFIGDSKPVINFLNLEQINEIRILFLLLQNKGKFKNFSENKLSEILTYNFQTLEKNSGNSKCRNRQFIASLRRRKDVNNTIYYCDFKILKKSIIQKYL